MVTDDCALRMTVTNSGAFCATCACGWVGVPKLVPVTREKGDRKKRHPALAERDAVAEFNAHAYVLDPGVEMRNYRCEVCRREFAMAAGTVACPHCGGLVMYARSRL